MKGYGNYDKYPELEIKGFEARQGYDSIAKKFALLAKDKERFVIVMDCYTQVEQQKVREGLSSLGATWFFTDAAMTEKKEYNARIAPFVTNDRVFGVMNALKFTDFIEEDKAEKLRAEIGAAKGVICVMGVCASLVASGDLTVYLDLARWEIQRRFARGATNWNTDNAQANKLAKFKQGFFVEWRMADRHKRNVMKTADYLLDTNDTAEPKLVSGEGWRKGLKTFASRPFRLVPYFAPEVWGGQWMKEVCGLDKSEKNYAWAFDGVPEENSIFMRFGNVRVEVPSIDVVFYRPAQLLGNKVHARFGDEYPIRFDFLDTMGGQNLSLQVHPLTEYIQHTFGMHYTQDESYYILDCEDNTHVYLGLKENVDKDKMLADLEKAQRGECEFPAEKYVNKFPVKKHDHFLIPAGTVHCSGSDTMVLEISATPYIFTFKLWDWSRLGLDGLPRPVHINHGKHVIQWDRDTEWVKKNLVNRFEQIKKEEGFTEERTGLHEREFIETRRMKITGKATVKAEDSVTEANVVDGKGAIIESPTGAFEPYEVHYAETFIIPASAGDYTVRPLDGEVTIIKATVRG